MEDNLIVRVFSQAEKEYESLPEWKKKLWNKEDFLKEHPDKSSIRQVRYDNADWT
jgi:hypothetical protein